MKTPTLRLQAILIAFYSDGSEKEMPYASIIGCWEMCDYLNKYFGIKTSPSTVHRGKKVFEPTKYPYIPSKFQRYLLSKKYFLAYMNWALNFPKEERAKFFSNEPDITKFIKNNPVIDIRLVVRK